jgi:D-threo-aldose 1-dehydrogenase
MTDQADTIQRRRVGRTAVEVGVLGFGGATIGGIGRRVTEAQARETLDAAWSLGLRYYDTAPFYGLGVSELRVGGLLREKPRTDFVISTKVGRMLRAPVIANSRANGAWVGGGPFEVLFDYSYAGVMRAYEDSLQRLGLARIDMAFVHDLDVGTHAHQTRWEALLAQLLTGGWRALAELRAAGQIGAIGFGINPRGMIPRLLELFDPDVFLLAGRYTLMEQETLADELPMCVEGGVGVVIGAVFNSGILASGAESTARYDYRAANVTELEKVSKIEQVCKRYDVPLVAAALQFPLAHPAVAAVIPGPRSAEEVESNVRAMQHPIPADLWRDLKREGLLREDAPTPSDAVMYISPASV